MAGLSLLVSLGLGTCVWLLWMQEQHRRDLRAAREAVDAFLLRMDPGTKLTARQFEMAIKAATGVTVRIAGTRCRVCGAVFRHDQIAGHAADHHLDIDQVYGGFDYDVVPEVMDG